MTVLRNLRRVLVAVGGGLLVLLGLLGSALPILPGMIFLVAGLLLWSTEFPWAKQLLSRVRKWLSDRSGKDREIRWLGFGTQPRDTGEEEGG